MRVLFLLTLLISSFAFGGATRTIDADSITSSDKSKTFTLPSATDDLVGRTATQVLTNKTVAITNNSVSANYTALSTDDFITVDAAAADRTIDLFSAVGNGGKVLTIKKTDTSFNTVTIDPSSVETIDGDLTTTLDTVGESVQIVSDGSNWLLLKRDIPPTWVSFTPTGSWTTNTTYTGSWRRVGNFIEIRNTLILSGAPNAVILTVNIPSGLTIDTADYPSGKPGPSGQTYTIDAGVGTYSGGVNQNNTTSVYPLARNANATYAMDTAITSTIPITYANTDEIRIFYRAAIVGWND